MCSVHPVAGLGAASDEPTREALSLAIELRIGKHPVLHIESGLVWNATCGIAQQGCEGHNGLLQFEALECAACASEDWCVVLPVVLSEEFQFSLLRDFARCGL
jgi:hypothetical protein